MGGLWALSTEHSLLTIFPWDLPYTSLLLTMWACTTNGARQPSSPQANSQPW